MSAVCVFGARWMAVDWALSNRGVHALQLGAVIVAAAVVFFAVARLLRVEEMDDLTGALRRRLKR
jgi:hypothetical protein